MCPDRTSRPTRGGIGTGINPVRQSPGSRSGSKTVDACDGALSWTDPERSRQRRLIRTYHAERNSRTPRFYALINKTVCFRSLERRPPEDLIARIRLVATQGTGGIYYVSRKPG